MTLTTRTAFSAATAVVTAWALGACGGTQATKTVTVTSTATSARTTTTTPAQPPAKKPKKLTSSAHAASALRSCDANITAKRATTSCRFAENVFYGFWKASDQGDDGFTAYSPVTKRSYPLSCVSGTTVVCRAGDGGEVHFTMAAIRAYTAENAAHYAATHDTGPSNPPGQDSAPSGDDGDAGSGSDCDSSYEGQCLDPNSPDYDCEGGSGDGPDYTGPVTVVGDDHFGLDRDGDGSACE